MTAIGQFIRERREEIELTQTELAEKVRVDQGTVSKWENGHRAPNYAERKRLAAVFGLKMEEFEDRWRAWSVARTQGEPGKIPVINYGPTGIATDYEEYGVDSGQGHKYIESAGVNDDLAFAVEVIGDSMEPWTHQGDILIFTPMTVPRPRATLKDGDVVYVKLIDTSANAGSMVARLERRLDEGRIEFSKDNRKYPSIVAHREEIEQLAAFVEKRSRRQDRIQRDTDGA